jgi:hypothetical protein
MANPKDPQEAKIRATVNANVNPNATAHSSGTVTNTVTDIQGTGTLTGVRKEGDFKLVAEGSEAEKALKFDTGEKLKKYQEDMRVVNNLQVDDPMRYQEEHGFYPRRGSSLEMKEDMKGLSQQDRIDVVAGRKSLESVDANKGTYRAV